MYVPTCFFGAGECSFRERGKEGRVNGGSGVMADTWCCGRSGY